MYCNILTILQFSRWIQLELNTNIKPIALSHYNESKSMSTLGKPTNFNDYEYSSPSKGSTALSVVFHFEPRTLGHFIIGTRLLS